MWACPNLDISVQRNAVTPVGFQVTDANDGQPLSLAAFTLSCGVKYAAGSGSILANPVITIVDASIGKFDVLFDGRSFGAVMGTQEPVALAYEILATDSGGPVPLVRGALYLFPGIL